MDKAIWKSTEEWSNFLGNILVVVKVVVLPDYLLVLPDYLLVLSILKHRGVGTFWTKKLRTSNRKSLFI